MKTTAAVLWEMGGKWEVEEVELDPPNAGEVLVELAASGLCHSDEHLVTGDLPVAYPMVGGHEGAGRVLEIGEGVTDVEVGDPVVMTFLPSCGRCSYCVRGYTNLCNDGAGATLGPQLDGTYRFHARGEDIGQMCLLGTFAKHTVVPVKSVVKIDEGFPLHLAALVGCGVTTGFGSAVRTAELRAGDTAVVVGIGGIGANAVQGAKVAGCRYVVAVDPVEFKRRKALELGATHVAESMDEAWNVVSEITRGQLADAAIVTTGVAEGDYLQPALQLVGKKGRVVITALGAVRPGHRQHLPARSHPLREAGPRVAVRQLQRPARRAADPGDGQPRPAQARGADHPRVHARPGQPGIRGHAPGPQHPRPDPLLRLIGGHRCPASPPSPTASGPGSRR